MAEVCDALRSSDMKRFTDALRRSGDSSYKLLQNIYPPERPDQQGIALAIAVSNMLLEGRTAVTRVHGGGFAGTVQSFVPGDFAEEYRAAMDSYFGEGACAVMNIRGSGAVRIV